MDSSGWGVGKHAVLHPTDKMCCLVQLKCSLYLPRNENYNHNNRHSKTTD